MNEDEKKIIEDIQTQFDDPARNIAKIARGLYEAGQKNQHSKDEALSLLQQCQEYDIAPPTELIDLIAAFIGDDRRNAYPPLRTAAGLGRVGEGREAEHIMRNVASEYGVTATHYPKLVAAAKFEAAHDPDPEGIKTSTASYSQISETAGIGRPTVRKYQTKEKYRALVIELRAELSKGGNVP